MVPPRERRQRATGGIVMALHPVKSAFSVEGEGPPLFLIHGIGASRHSWDGVVSRLKAHFRCISYDLAGHGLSPPAAPSEMCSEDLVEDLEALRAELGISVPISPAIRSAA